MDFVRDIIHEKIYLSLNGTNHHGMQLARHRITSLHAAGVAIFHQKKTGVSYVLFWHEPIAIALPANAFVVGDFHWLYFERPNQALGRMNGDGNLAEQSGRAQWNFD